MLTTSIHCREYPLLTEADLPVEPVKTWADYVADVEAQCAGYPIERSPFRPCRSDMIRTALEMGCAFNPDMRRARDEAFAARMSAGWKLPPMPRAADIIRSAVTHPDFAAAVERNVARVVAK